ncbi:MAG: hypothetical protein WD151_14730 [Phycisphaeraceae bacterium]
MASQVAFDSSSPAERLALWLDGRRRWVFGLIALTYLAAYNGRWLIGPDSALYSTIGRNLAEGHGYTYHGQPHTLVYPLLPWLLGGLWQITGVSHFAAATAMLTLALLALALVYRLARLHLGRPHAVAVTALVALTDLVHHFSFHVLTDIPFFLGVVAVLAGYEGIRQRGGDGGAAAPPARPHEWADWLLLAGGLMVAVLARPTMWALVAALLATAAWHLLLGPQRWRHAAIGGLTVAALGVFYLIDPRRHAAAAAQHARPGTADASSSLSTTSPAAGHSYESGVLAHVSDPMALFEHIREQSLPALLDAHAIEAMLAIELGPALLNAVGGLVVIALGLAMARRRVLWGALVAATLAMMLVHLPVVRYFMPLIPIMAMAWWLVVLYVSRRLPERGAHWASVALLTLVLGPNIGHVIKTIIRQRQTPFYEHYEHGAYLPYLHLGERLPDVVEPDAWVVSEEGRLMTFQSRRRVVERYELSHLADPAAPGYVLEPADDPLLDDDLLDWRRGEPVHTFTLHDRRWLLRPLIPAADDAPAETAAP